MKKLLFLINIVCFCFLYGSCQNASKPKTENASESKPIIDDSIIATDTIVGHGQTGSAGTVGTVQGMTKDTVNIPVKGNAIIHHAPNEDKIDSIKNSKHKVKK